MSEGRRDVSLSELESIVENALPYWLRHVWPRGSETQVSVLERSFRGLYENSVALVEDLGQLGSWSDYESYAIIKGHFIDSLVRHWRTIVRHSGLLVVFRDSDVLVCSQCGRAHP
jgi:hypothetical protein